MAAAPVKAGDVLDGKYRVEHLLGTGGMGIVVAARHVELGQRVALKFMLKEGVKKQPAQAERFAREAKAAVRLQSPHTARVLDVGKLKKGEPYMVMEYLDGEDLDAALERHGPMPPRVAVDYILQACEAFAEAHSLGMIHRDIKLKNLFLTHTVDGQPFIKVLDFGLAKTIGLVGDVSLTATSAVFGSPQYMSPEQMKSAKDVDTRSDIWSLGVCLYELMTGRVPFDATGLAEVCAMVLKDPVEPPSKWAPGIPPPLESVVMRCLAKDPANRYQTVADLAFALEPWATTNGAAQRVLHVMQTVQKTEMPTIISVDTSSLDEGKRTVSAWDTGAPSYPPRGIPRPVMLALRTLGILGLLALVAIVSVALTQRRIATTAAGAAAAPSAPSASVDPAPSSLSTATSSSSDTIVLGVTPTASLAAMGATAASASASASAAASASAHHAAPPSRFATSPATRPPSPPPSKPAVGTKKKDPRNEL